MSRRSAPLDKLPAGGYIALRCIDLNGQTASQNIHPLVCTKTSELYHYVIVRKDLPLGDQLAQAVHAAGESSDPKPEPGCTAVVLHAVDETHLRIIQSRLDKHGLKYHCIVECADDVDYPSQLMAIGLSPTVDRAKIKRALSSLPLARQ